MTNETTKRIISSIVLVPFAFFFIIKGSYFFIFFISMCFLITIYEWYQISSKKNYFFFGLFFLILSFYSVYLFREKYFVFFLLVFLTCIGTDIGGYIFGKIFKGPKLIKISPNKTYAGMIGGFFLSIIIAYIFLANNSKISEYANLKFVYDYSISFSHFFLVLMISLISQIGDLLISYFKRISKVKNTGKIIPGHGGLLDRIDGMIFAFPIAFLIFYIY